MYAILTDENFRHEVLENSGPVLVELGAAWCGGSHIMAPVLEQLASQYSQSLKIGRLDVDVNTQIPVRYGVRDIPTLLFFRQGQLVGRIKGAISRKDLEIQLLAKLLNAYSS